MGSAFCVDRWKQKLKSGRFRITNREPCGSGQHPQLYAHRSDYCTYHTSDVTTRILRAPTDIAFVCDAAWSDKEAHRRFKLRKSLVARSGSSYGVRASCAQICDHVCTIRVNCGLLNMTVKCSNLTNCMENLDFRITKLCT
jgi:hypothetical protein